MMSSTSMSAGPQPMAADRLGRMRPAGPAGAEDRTWIPARPAVWVEGRAPRERPEDDEVLVPPAQPLRAHPAGRERPEDDEVLVTWSRHRPVTGSVLS